MEGDIVIFLNKEGIGGVSRNKGVMNVQKRVIINSYVKMLLFWRFSVTSFLLRSSNIAVELQK